VRSQNYSQMLVRAAMLALLGMMLLPGAALAATYRSDVWQSGSISLADLNPKLAPTYVVTLHLKDGIKLPTSYQVAVPVPAGSTLLWAGEVVGENPAGDITARDVKTVKAGKQMLVTFTMTKSRFAQVEVNPPTSTVGVYNDQIDLKWTPLAPIGRTLLAVRVPADFHAENASQITTIVPVQADQSYVREYKQLAAGQTGQITMDIVEGAPAAPAPAPAVVATPAVPTTATVRVVRVVPVAKGPRVLGMPVAIFVVVCIALVALIAVVILLVMMLRKGSPPEE
jgi:hypothetical protein